MNRHLQTDRRCYQPRVFALRLACVCMLLSVFAFQTGCACRLPAIDPTGNRVFLPRPYSTSIAVNPLRAPQPPAVVSFQDSQPVVGVAPSVGSSSVPIPAAFQHPPDPPPCNQPFVNNCGKKHIIPYAKKPHSNAGRGQIISTPHRIVAPVGSEVVVLSGICGGDGRFALNQPLEWILSNDSVGQFIEVGGTQHSTFNRLVSPTAKKIDGQYAHGRTGLKERLVTRGTPTPADDITLLKGQTFVSVASASPGTSYVTSVAPKAAGWDKRRATTLIHWVDGNWSIPVPTSATAGTVHPMVTQVTSATGDGGVPDWKVRYTIVGGAPAEFVPTGSQTAEAVTTADGLAVVQLRQSAGQFAPGTTQVRVDVIRPKQFGEPELVVESGVTTVTWSAPQLNLRVNGPVQASVDQPFNYRILVSNPGDQVARDVTVSTSDLSQDVEFISSAPKPTEYGNTYQWQLGDIAPGDQAKIIDVQLKSSRPGNVGLCFDVASQTDGLQTQACAQTEIAAICIGLEIEGPTEAKVGEEVDFNFIIVNQCNESLRNLEFVVNYDPGLSATGLGNPIRYKIDSIGFGQREQVPLTFKVLEAGRKCFELSITADDGKSAQSRTCITATPSLPGDEEPDAAQLEAIGIAVSGQQRIEDGRTTLTSTVLRNNTRQPISGIILTNRYSPSLNPIQVTKSYIQRWIGEDLAFEIGTLNPGEEALVEVEYEALQPDANAFSEMTVVTTNEAQSNIGRLDIRIEPAGTLGPQEGGIGIPGDRDQGGQLPEGGQVPREPNGRIPNDLNSGQPSPTPGDRIGIPPEGASQGGLQIDVQALDKTVRVGDNARIQFTVRNMRNTTDEDIDVTMLIPPSLQLVDYDDSRWRLAIKDPGGDPTKIRFERRNQMRPDGVDPITFIAIVKAIQTGTATFEVQATSRNTVGTVSNSDTVFVQ